MASNQGREGAGADTSAAVDTPLAVLPQNQLGQLRELCKNCRLGKHKHFRAADRKQHLSELLGYFLIISSGIISALLYFRLLAKTAPDWLTIPAVFLATLATILSGVQSFAQLAKRVETHRDVGNRYLYICRKAELIIAELLDRTLDPKESALAIRELIDEYDVANRAAEAVSTSQNDFLFAKAQLVNAEVSPPHS
tara:strand:- start:998 stop:1585 length:588 start_codon:yes stop_codon:yes gene_type:complete